MLSDLHNGWRESLFGDVGAQIPKDIGLSLGQPDRWHVPISDSLPCL